MKPTKILLGLAVIAVSLFSGGGNQSVSAQTYYYQRTARGHYYPTYPNSYFYSPTYYGWEYDDVGVPYYTSYYPGPYYNAAGVYYGGVPATMGMPGWSNPPLISNPW